MSKVAAILGFYLVALLILSSGPVSAQTRKESPRAVKFDEFGKVGHCDPGAWRKVGQNEEEDTDPEP